MTDVTITLTAEDAGFIMYILGCAALDTKPNLTEHGIHDAMHIARQIERARAGEGK